MSEDIKCKIGVVQMDCVLGEIEPNLAKIDCFAQAAGELGADLVVFPECATTGYFVAPDLERLAEPPGGPTERALGDIARRAGVRMAVGTVVADDGGFFDAQVLFEPDGSPAATYYKAHLFAAERDCYRAGGAPVVADSPIGGLGLTICYDLIFPDYIRRLTELGADVVINSTDWISDPYLKTTWGWSGPTVEALAITRALENGIFVAMANRVGHEMGFDSIGHSCVVAPSGMILASLRDGEGLAVANIDFAAEDVHKWRAIATYRQDRRPEIYS